MLGKHVSICPAGHEEDSCRTLCYVTEYTTKSSFCIANNKTLPILWQHLPQSEICDLYPGIKPVLWGKDRVPRCIVFSHVPPSYCESQYDLSDRVRGKWADHCQLLYPGAGEDPRACQRTSPRRWRLLSMLRMTAMKGYTLNNKVNDPPEMFFFLLHLF